MQRSFGEGRGVFCNFNDSDSIAERVIEVIENKRLRQSLEQAYRYSRNSFGPQLLKTISNSLMTSQDNRNELAIRLPPKK